MRYAIGDVPVFAHSLPPDFGCNWGRACFCTSPLSPFLKCAISGTSPFECIERNEMTLPAYDKGEDKVKSLIAETMAFSGNIYNGNLYESYFTGFGTPQEETLFAIIDARYADNGAILQSANLYVYCANNPVMYVDPWGLATEEEIENATARLTLRSIAFYQYKNLFVAKMIPGVADVVEYRILSSIQAVEDNKDTINAIAKAYGVRADIIGGIIYKEQLTQSLPDLGVIADVELGLTNNPHSIGLGAVTTGLARDSWNYVNQTVYNSLPEDNADLLRMLTDPDFNIQTMAAGLIYIAEYICNISRDKLINLPDKDWEPILYEYNCANNYNEKVIEYLPYIKELLD